MNVVLQIPQRLLLSVTADELTGICNSLNEVCNGVHIEAAEFESRLGVTRAFLVELLKRLQAGAHSAHRAETRATAWADGASVQVICVTVWGDPVDLSSDEARIFAEQLRKAIAEAEA